MGRDHLRLVPDTSPVAEIPDFVGDGGAEYASPFIGRCDSTGLRDDWRGQLAQLLRCKVPRSDLVAEVITLELLPLHGNTAPQLGEGEPHAAVRVFRMAVRWLVGMGLSSARIRVLLEDTLDDASAPPPRAG